MKTFTGLLLIITLSVAYIPSKDNDKILWSKEYSLQWKDFKGPVKENAGYDAMTAYAVESGKEDGKFGIFCYFDKSKSWRVRKKESDLLLKHEQYHFNLAEVYARKIRKQIIELNLLKDTKQLDKVFKDNLRQLEIDQKSYDKETNHSKVIEAQTKWEVEIDKELDEFKNFANPLVE